MKASDKVCPPWKKATLKDRLTDCRRMLHLHDMLTDKESEKVLRRILKTTHDGRD